MIAEAVTTGARLRVEEVRELTPPPNDEFEPLKNLRQAGWQEGLVHTAPEYPPLLQREIFELVSFAIPARWQGVRSETDRVVLEQEFRNQVAIALTPFVEQLPVGDGLVAEYELSPVGGGAVTLVARFAVECCGNAGADGGLDEELRTCLSALSDHYTFRAIDRDMHFPGRNAHKPGLFGRCPSIFRRRRESASPCHAPRRLPKSAFRQWTFPARRLVTTRAVAGQPGLLRCFTR